MERPAVKVLFPFLLPVSCLNAFPVHVRVLRRVFDISLCRRMVSLEFFDVGFSMYKFASIHYSRLLAVCCK
jgi:hypothetical protein